MTAAGLVFNTDSFAKPNIYVKGAVITNSIITQNTNLPSTIEELNKFVLIGREKLVAVRAEIRAIDKVGLAKEVREQKLAEAQDIADAVLDAEVRIGELMLQVPKASGGDHGNQYTNGKSNTSVIFAKPEPKTYQDLPFTSSEEDQAERSVEEPVEEKPKTKTEVIEKSGFTKMQVSRFETLAKNPELVAQAKAEARQNDDIVSRSLVLDKVKEQKRAAKEAAREEARLENAEKVEALSSPLEAQGLFQTIVIDPPWDWGDEGDVNQFGRAKPDYHTMPIEDIEKLPVAKIADDNCHLYLWVTNRSLPKAFRLIEAWGFRYITCLTWVKPYFGMGNYFRGSTEQILFAVKGSQPLKRKDVGTHFEAPRGNGHSAKPDEFYSLVESCSYGPYIDIFGRKERDGWSVWGENA